MPAASLDRPTYLSRFYAELEKNGPLYTKSAIIKLLYALILYCDSVPYIACTHFEMRYNKTNRDWRYRSRPLAIFPQLRGNNFQ